jgi:1-acyl-sn-glycerol-3-phosphate acyltransferase
MDPCESAHRTARDIAGLMDLDLEVGGSGRPTGLIVCNHLGYLDVIVIASLFPTVFVAKSEVRDWPVFGWFAARMGCVFAERGRPSSAARSLGQIQAALRAGRRVVLFPEGTSSAGDRTLPFRSSLLEAAVGVPVTVAAVRYRLDPGDGDPARDVCYWGDMTFVPHLIRLFGRRRVRASLAWEPFEAVGLGRKELAAELRRRVARLAGQADPTEECPSFDDRLEGEPTRA